MILNPEIQPEIQSQISQAYQFFSANNFAQAEDLCLVVIEQDNYQPEAYHLLGLIAYAQKNFELALECYHHAIKLQPFSAIYYYNLALAYDGRSDHEKAIESYQKSLEQAKTDAQKEKVITALGKALHWIGRNQEALDYFGSGALAFGAHSECYWWHRLFLPVLYQSKEELDFYFERYQRGLDDLIQNVTLNTEEEVKLAYSALQWNPNFYLTYQGKDVFDLHYRYGQLVSQIMVANFPQWSKTFSKQNSRSDKKIRIGYLSGYLCRASGSYWIAGWIRHHDLSQFEIYCYHTGETIDQVTQDLKEKSEGFHHIHKNLEKLCGQILNDQLDILVFGDVGMEIEMTQLAGLRLAPVQCVAWGHPVTSGGSQIDYFISNVLMEPEDAQSHYSESLQWLPGLGAWYPKPQVANIQRNRETFKFSDDHIIYLSCQTTFKYLPQYDWIYPAIAQQLPSARFVFVSEKRIAITEQFKQRLSQAFERVGLEMNNFCTILPRLDHPGYLSLLASVDIWLDTFDFSGCITTFDAAAFGLPMVTCPGQFLRARQTYGILKCLEVTDTVAKTEQDYIELAVRLGTDPLWRGRIRTRILAALDRLYENTSCMPALEDFYRRIAKRDKG